MGSGDGGSVIFTVVGGVPVGRGGGVGGGAIHNEKERRNRERMSHIHAAQFI